MVYPEKKRIKIITRTVLSVDGHMCGHGLTHLTLKSSTENIENTSFSKLSGSNEVKVSDQLLLLKVDIKF